ncbi:villin-4-like isoform X2 [Primulina huaijiensis]|uniref:villin-4-like isoform X2 n=1 Tax=Primulina huaijiensis TaxID=1492673 RepID=UPI003CC7612E
MSISKDLDPVFKGAGQKVGIEIWRIENFNPVPIPKSSHGKFFTGDSYVILKTTTTKNGALHHAIHYWLGKDTSQDEAGAAAIKTVELDAALGGRAVQYREVQGHETEKFLSYFKPCIIPQEGGVASGFNHVEAEAHQTRLFECKGKHVVHVKEVPFARSSLNHDNIFILDTESKIFQFNGSNSSIQERAKALEVVQYVKDTYHDGKCEIAVIEDGKLMADADSGEFWAFFGGFAPLPKKTTTNECKNTELTSPKLFCIENGEAVPVEADSLIRELLDSYKCYLVDCGTEAFVWMGRNTSLTARKAARKTVDEVLHGLDRSECLIIGVIEGFETVLFRSKFDLWPHSNNVSVTEEGRGKVAALLNCQGVNVKGLLKSESPKEDHELYIDCTGDLQVWRVNGENKCFLPASDQSKFYSGDCYIFHYSYPGKEKEDHLIGTWFGKQSVEVDREGAASQTSKMVESMKFLPTQARIYEGNEPIQFFAIFQSFIVFKGGLSEAFKNHMAKNELPDNTFAEDGLALFRVQGNGPDNMQAIQVEPVASSLNSSYCYILLSGSFVFTWSGSITSPEDRELVERLLDLIKPNMQPKLQKEGTESEQFWDLLGGKLEYSSQKIAREAETDPHLFSCTLLSEDVEVTEIYNFNQDDLMTEDIFILDCHSDIYVWVGQQVQSKKKMNPLNIGEKFLERDFLLEKLSLQTPIYIITEGSEPTFFTRFFSWDSTKSMMHGDSFQRKLSVLLHGVSAISCPKRRTPISYGGRSAAPEKSQRSRSVSSFSPDRVRVRGRSPAFNAIAANFENTNARNMSTPPPMVTKLFPKSVTLDSAKLTSRSAAIALISAGFEQPAPARDFTIPRSVKVSHESPKSKSETNADKNSNDSPKPKPETILEDVKEGEAEEDRELPVHPYERLTTTSTDPVEDIDVTKREKYLSSQEFKEKFEMTKDAFYKLPKWKQNKIKMTHQLF